MSPNTAMRIFNAGLCLAVFLGSSLSAAWAQTGRIGGAVRDADTGAPLKGASVQVTGPPLKAAAGAISDDDGKYAIEKVPPGQYSVRATFVGYLPQIVASVEVIAGQSISVDFSLNRAPVELEETVVSVSRRPENIIDAPASVSKIDWRELQRNTAGNSYVGAIKNVKGIDRTQMGILHERFNARGFNSALNTRMLQLIDGRVTKLLSGASTPVYTAPTVKDDLQDIEVIVGPGSALYGPDAISGVVSLTTKDPRDFQGSTVALTAGSRDLFKGRFHHAGLSGKWGWKASAEYQQARDFEQTNTYTTGDGAVSVADEPDFDSSIQRGGLGLFYYPNSESRVGLSTGAVSIDLIAPINTGRTQAKGWVYHYQHFDFSTPNLYLSLYNSGDDTGDSFGLHMDANNRLAGFPPEEARRMATFNGDSALREAEARYRFCLSDPRKTYFTIGSNLRQERADGWLMGGGAEATQVGFYGHVEAELEETFRVVLASRADFHEIYGTQLSPKAALIFKPDPQTALRITFNRAYRSPSINDQYLYFPVSPVVIARGNGEGFRFGTVAEAPLPSQYEDGIPKLKPEENTTLELGFKGVLATRVFLDLSGYRSRYRNFTSPLTSIGDLASGIVTLDKEGNPRAGEVTLTYLNFGKQTVWGFDAGVNVYATDRLTFKGNTSFIEAGDLETKGGLDQPFNTPGAIFNLGLSASDFLIEGTSLDLSLRHVSEHDFRSGVHVGTVRAYSVADAHLVYRTQYGIHYKLSATNLLDNAHRAFVDGPKIGRIVAAELQCDF